MITELDDLRVLKGAESVADEISELIISWKPFEKDVIGKQLTRAVDSIGANIAEAYGRYHYGERIQFLYYARGSIYESKYWLNRAEARKLISQDKVQHYLSALTMITRQLNRFVGNLKEQQYRMRKQVRESDDAESEYMAETEGTYGE